LQKKKENISEQDTDEALGKSGRKMIGKINVEKNNS